MFVFKVSNKVFYILKVNETFIFYKKDQQLIVNHNRYFMQKKKSSRSIIQVSIIKLKCSIFTSFILIDNSSSSSIFCLI